MIKVLWLHLYHGDQLSPFAFIYRGWLWVLGVILFFVIQRGEKFASQPLLPLVFGRVRQLSRCFGYNRLIDARRDKTVFLGGNDWIFWGLLTSGVVMVSLSMHDLISTRRLPINYSFVFEERNTYATFWILVIGLVTYLWKSQSKLLGIVAYVLFILFSLLLFASLSLSGIVSWFVVVGLALFSVAAKQLAKPFTLSFYRRNWLPILVSLLFLYFLFPTLALVVPSSDPITVAEHVGYRIRTLMPGQQSQILLQGGRVLLWVVSLRMIVDYPVFGIGIGRYYLESGEYLQRAKGIPGFFAPHENAHNYFLQIAAETGIVGFALFVCLLVWLLVRRWDFRGRNKNTAAGIAIIGLLVMSLTGHPLLVQSIFFMSCAMAGLVAKCPSENGCRVSGVGCQGNAGEEGEEEAASKRMGRKAVRLPRSVWISLAGILLVLYIFHVRSIWNVLPQNFEWGFYATEGEGNQAYRWTRGLALKLMGRDQLKPFSVRAANPDLPQRAVKVMICADDHVLKELELRDDAWHPVEIQTQQLPPRFVLGIKSSQTWTPAKYGPPDYRELGVMVRF